MTASVVNAQPLIDAIEAAVTAAGVAFDVGRKPANATTRYIVAWPDGGLVDNRTLRSRDGWSTVIVFQCYGLTPEAVSYAVRTLRAVALALHGQVVVGGRTLLMPEHLGGSSLSRDDDADPPLFMQADEWRIRLA